MRSTPVKDIFLGIAIAHVAAYVFSIIIVWNPSHHRGLLEGDLYIAALYLLFYGFWLVIPLGIILGIVIPKMVYDKTRWIAALHGAAIGIVAALMVMSCLWMFFGISSWSEALNGLFWIAAYFTVWTSLYAFIRARGKSLYK
jgi:hypothetical protein